VKRAALLLGLLACSGKDTSEKTPVTSEAPRSRRVIEPPVGVVRALPPYPIKAQSVGPYKLGEKLSDLMEQLPSGPRMALFEVPGLLHRSLVRAEDAAVLIGGEPQGTATFVAVVGSEVARTESGVHVGSTRPDQIAAMGPPHEEPDRARDPRHVIPSSMRNARIVLDGDRVAAITILAEPAPAAPAPAQDCVRPASTDKAIGACFTGAGELVEVGENEVTVRAGERVVTQFRVPNVVFAVPLRTADGRDELVAIARTDEPQLRSWSLVAFRFEGGKLVKTIDPTALYQVSSANARWIGAEVRDVDLYLELATKADAIEVGGLLTTRAEDGQTRDVVVISTFSVAHRRGKPAASEAGSAEPPDAGADARDGGGRASPDSPKP
jgi:hypothetical protein